MCKTEIFANALKIVSQETEIPGETILGNSRKEEVVDARTILVTILLELGLYPEQIATYLNRTPAGIRHLAGIFPSRKRKKLLQMNLQVIRKKLESNS